MKRLYALLAGILRIKEETIREDLTPGQVAAWDSMNALVLVATLEKTYNIKFTMAEVIGVKCIGDIIKVLQKHGVDLNIAD